MRYKIAAMGAWGYTSVENDAGLDEIALLFEKSDLAEHIRQSLQQDVRECSDEIRATAFLVYVLAKNQLWQHESLREITALAISRLNCMLKNEFYSNVNFMGEVIHLINQLREVEPKRSLVRSVFKPVSSRNTRRSASTVS